MKTIKIGQKEYPVRVTMGTIREFKKLTGKEVEQIQGSSEVGEFLYACTISACRAEKVEFTLGVDDFVDQLEFGPSADLFTSLLEEAGMSANAQPEKKSKR